MCGKSAAHASLMSSTFEKKPQRYLEGPKLFTRVDTLLQTQSNIQTGKQRAPVLQDSLVEHCEQKRGRGMESCDNWPPPSFQKNVIRFPVQSFHMLQNIFAIQTIAGGD